MPGVSAAAAIERAVAALPLLALPGDPDRPQEWDREPPGEEPWADDGPPDGPLAAADAVLALLPPGLQAECREPATALDQLPPGERVGWFARWNPHGSGFAIGGAADDLPPGEVLAGLANREWASPLTQPGAPAGELAWRGDLARVSDDGLIGLMRAWRRLASWAAAGEAAAIAELDRRRTAAAAGGADPHLAEHVTDEIAIALTLTTRAADGLHAFATRLVRLPQTMAALAAGRIDLRKASVITEAVTGLSPVHAAAVEAAVIKHAPAQTSGQLRAALRRAVLAVDPQAERNRREEAKKDARVEVWEEPAGTAALAGRDLPAADVLAADKHLTALARYLKSTGAEGTLAQLRARAYLALLLGHPLDSVTDQSGTPASTAGSDPEPGGRDAGGSKAGGSKAGAGPASPGAGAPASPAPAIAAPVTPGAPVLTGVINLTMPLTTWLGGATGIGEVPGYGPISAEDAQRLARRLASGPATRWCLTLTSPTGQAVAHGCARRTLTGPGPDDWELAVTIRPLATGGCSHQRQANGYAPSPVLRHLIRARQPTCSAPGCRRPATTCDLDHTTPYHQGGRTCECNLAPLCRRHHRAKQTRGWQLKQTAPGTFTWQLPHHRSYTVTPSPYPPDRPPDGSARAGPDPGA